MATTDNTIGTDESVSKTVTVVGYADDKEQTFREWADKHDDERDYHRMETREETDYFLEANGERIGLKERAFEKLEGSNLGDASLVAEVDEQREYAVREMKFANYIRSRVVDGLPEEIAGYELSRFGSPCYRDDDRNAKVNFYRYAETMPLLKHQSEIEPDDMFEDEDEEWPAVKFRINIKDVDKDELTTINDEVVGPFMNRLGLHSAVGRVRVAECEQETRQEGVCLNI